MKIHARKNGWIATHLTVTDDGVTATGWLIPNDTESSTQTAFIVRGPNGPKPGNTGLTIGYATTIQVAADMIYQHAIDIESGLLTVEWDD